MTGFLHGVARATVEAFHLSGPVLEVGSFQVPGQHTLADLRPLFSAQQYIGLDSRPGPGVDVVADVEALPYPDATFGTVLAMSTFEHVQRFWLGFDEIHRVLRPDGVLLFSSPFYFHLHHEPHDYWRFSPDALDFMLQSYPNRIIGWHGPTTRPANVWAVAFREACPVLTPSMHWRYRHALSRHAHMPLSWWRWLRLGFAARLFGRGHFAPYLDRERWDTRCVSFIPSSANAQVTRS